MSALTLNIPAELADSLKVPAEERDVRVRRELAVRLYAKGLLTLGKSRALAGLSKWEFCQLLSDESVPRRYDEADLNADMETLESFR
jgi:predicted HTH domain antitoxin